MFSPAANVCVLNAHRLSALIRTTFISLQDPKLREAFLWWEVGSANPGPHVGPGLAAAPRFSLQKETPAGKVGKRRAFLRVPQGKGPPAVKGVGGARGLGTLARNLPASASMDPLFALAAEDPALSPWPRGLHRSWGRAGAGSRAPRVDPPEIIGQVAAG